MYMYFAFSIKWRMGCWRAYLYLKCKCEVLIGIIVRFVNDLIIAQQFNNI